MIFGNTEEHEIFRMLPIRFAKLPERTAEGVKTSSRHIDGAEAAMRRVIRCAELRGPPSGQALALIAAGKESKFFRIRLAHITEPLCGK